MDSQVTFFPDAGFPWKPVQQFITVSNVAVILGFSDDYIRKVIVFLLDEGILLPEDDLIEAKPVSRIARKIRKQYRQFRIHKETGLAKIRAYLAAERS